MFNPIIIGVIIKYLSFSSFAPGAEVPRSAPDYFQFFLKANLLFFTVVQMNRKFNVFAQF
jgi:hypothetical protein